MEGYAKIASRVAAHPELGIYRRFGALNAQNILYLQAELHELEQELQQYAAEDAAAANDETRKRYSRDWYSLAESTGFVNPKALVRLWHLAVLSQSGRISFRSLVCRRLG